MDCSLCKKPIENYSREAHNIAMAGSCLADICDDCADRIVKWQGKRLARMFPTKAMKKRFGGE